MRVANMRAPEYTGCNMVERATWWHLNAYCAEQENGGRICGCRSWGDNRWQQAAQLKKAEAHHPCPLWSWDGEDLVVWRYPSDQEESFHAKREGNSLGGQSRSEAKVAAVRENGKKGGRPRKPQMEAENQSRNLSPNQSRNQTNRIEQNRREQNRTEENRIEHTPGMCGGDDSPAIAREVELPAHFPKSAEDAAEAGKFENVPREFAIKTWNKAASRGGRDARDVPIRNFRAYLQTEWAYERERMAKTRKHPESNQKQETLKAPRL